MKELFISVDVEADGPIPGDYSMSSFGACVIRSPELGFYRELKPISDKYFERAASVSGLDREKLKVSGADPAAAMQEFEQWLKEVCLPDRRPVFVAFNATYDWMFIHWYFIHFLGHNPFGISGWDIKAYYAGIAKKRFWWKTAKKQMDKKFLSKLPHTHNALDDAREQAEIFRRLRKEALDESEN